MIGMLWVKDNVSVNFNSKVEILDYLILFFVDQKSVVFHRSWMQSIGVQKANLLKTPE